MLKGQSSKFFRGFFFTLLHMVIVSTVVLSRQRCSSEIALFSSPKGADRTILHQVRLIFSAHPGNRQRRAVFVPSRWDVCLFAKGHSFLHEETFVPSRGDDCYVGAKIPVGGTLRPCIPSLKIVD